MISANLNKPIPVYAKTASGLRTDFEGNIIHPDDTGNWTFITDDVKLKPNDVVYFSYALLKSNSNYVYAVVDQSFRVILSEGELQIKQITRCKDIIFPAFSFVNITVGTSEYITGIILQCVDQLNVLR